MKKVVAFLEKYAEWLAMGVACIFLLYMVYAYVVSADDLRVPVGTESLMPDEVDPHINSSLLVNLQKEMENPKADVSFQVPDFVKGFSLAMSKDRDRMKPEYELASAFRPGVAPEGTAPQGPTDPKEQITALPVVPSPLFTAFNKGASLVKLIAAGVAGAVPPAAAAPGGDVDKTWIMWEGKIDSKALADAWKASLFNAKGESKVPVAVLATQFLRVEVERQEQIDSSTWSEPVSIPPLALAEIKDYPKVGDRNAEEEFRLWSEKKQVDIVEPPFYQIVKGDEWFIPSLRVKDAANIAAVEEGPFDPANPPKRELTAEEKAKVYQYRQKEQQEKQKAEEAARKAKLDSTRKPATPSGGAAGEGGGRRKIGGYAPLPGEGRVPGQKYDDGGRPISGSNPGRNGFNRGGVPREGAGRGLSGRESGRMANPSPMLNNGSIQNQALTGPFDPTMLVDAQGVPANIIMWVHDDTVVPGKTYRYRVRISLKNSIYNTINLTQNKAFETQLAITSEWSAWSPEIKAPPVTEYFVSRAVRQIGKDAINKISVDVFKHEKGEWSEATFDIGPGDSVGSVKNNTDFTTGMTIVDIRSDLREKDTKILVADEKGTITAISFEAQRNDKRYNELKDKVKNAAAAGPAAAAGTPSLINR